MRACALASVGLRLGRHVRARVGAHACALAGASSRTCGCACVRVYMHVLLFYCIIICSGAVCE